MLANIVKRRINRLAFTHIKSNGGMIPFQMDLFRNWKTPSEKRVDQLVASFPVLSWLRWLITPFYAVKAKWHRIFLFIAAIFAFATVNGVGTMILLWLGLYGGFLLVVGLGLKAYQTFCRSLSKNQEPYKAALVHTLNQVIHMTDTEPNITSYYVSEDKKMPDWFHIHLYTTTAFGIQGIDQSYLEYLFHKRIHQMTNKQESIYFQLYLMDQSLQPSSSPDSATQATTTSSEEMSIEEREKQLQEAMAELDAMVGLQPVKDYIHELNDWVALQNKRKKIGQAVSQQSMHMVFTGNPGTGKTTVARMVAKVLSALGVISKGQLVEVTRENLVAEYIGQTAPKTKKVVRQAIGGILFIDEAYTLARGGDNDFGREAIDTLVKEMEENRSNLVVILAGYTKEMQEFLKANSGLKSRFPNQIEFPDYTPEELLRLAQAQLKQEQLHLSVEAEKALYRVLQRKQIAGRMGDGNGRLVRNVIEEAIRKQSKRLHKSSRYGKEDLTMLLPTDFNAGETEDESLNMEAEFAQIVGNEKVKKHIHALLAQIKIQKIREEKKLSGSFYQSLHMVFTGNPGTGKTTFARLIGKVMKELGILKSGQLIETDRSGLVANYVGQTAPKVNEVIQEALGGVLFIDEAYALIPKGESDFGREAIDALVKGMEDHRENLVVILAGYDQDMDQFFAVNPGLQSRFPHRFHFSNYSATELYQILEKMVRQNQYELDKDCKQELRTMLEAEASNPESSNGRFVRNLFEQAVRNQAVRLQEVGTFTDEDLLLLKPSDFKVS